MKRTWIAAAVVAAATMGISAQQAPSARPMSPEGSAATQVLGDWTKPARPAFTLGRETYQNGKWIEITYGRPLQRGRDLFGSGADYGKAANDVGTQGLPAPPVWRAGANKSTRLKTEVALTLGNKTIPPGEYSLFVDLKLPEWTLIVSTWGATDRFEPNNKDALWGAYNYTADKDVARVPMKLDKLPYDVDQLTWTFLDVKRDTGRIALMWGNTLASTPFKASAP